VTDAAGRWQTLRGVGRVGSEAGIALGALRCRAFEAVRVQVGAGDAALRGIGVVEGGARGGAFGTREGRAVHALVAGVVPHEVGQTGA
jgi:hypothetical protein